MPGDLVTTAFAAFLVFARVGAMLMLLPGIAEPGVPPRIRLTFAILVSLVLAPNLAPLFPPMPEDTFPLAGLIIQEVLVGLGFGAVLRMVLGAITVAGQIISMQTGLAMAQALDPSLGTQSALIGAFLSVTATAFIFATGLHLVFIAGVAGVYQIVPPGVDIMVGDFAEMAIMTFVSAFRVGVQMAAPVIVFGLVFNLSLGVLSRLMPQAQIFFIGMPLTILMGMAILSATLGAALILWADFARDVAMELV